MLENLVIENETGMKVSTLEETLGFSYAECNLNEENRIKTVTSIAAISRGKDKANNPERRYKSLLKEAAGNYSFIDLENTYGIDDSDAPGRPLEYIPVVIHARITETNVSLYPLDSHIPFTNISNMQFAELCKFSTPINAEYVDTVKLQTNLRALINLGIPYEDIPYNEPEDLKHYFVAKVKAPYFVFAQIRTHGQMPQVAVSGRVMGEEELWLPSDIVDRLMSDKIKDTCNTSIRYLREQLFKANNDNEISNIINNFKIDLVTTGSVLQNKEIFKELGYHKEVYDRFPNLMYMKEWIIAGHLNDKYQWGHLLLEREAYPELHKSWVQETTKETAVMLRQLIKKRLLEQ